MFKLINYTKTTFIRVIAYLLLTLFCTSPIRAEVHPINASGLNRNDECVILLHGMARTHDSMNDLQSALVKGGYHTFNVDYPSTDKPIRILASQYIPPALAQAERKSCRKIHFVTHSLGGIVVRTYLKENQPNNLGHVVMLSPPNQGSVVAQKLKDEWYYQWLNGPAGQELAAAPNSIPTQLGGVSYSVGIITGNTHAFFDGWLLPFFEEDNDGKVSISEARLDGMTDFLVVEESHPFIMDSKLVHEEVLHYLQHGTFSERSKNSTP
ncbi:MAG: alpha/beta hydrolase [Desulfobulbaceae bacterium]|mgnify:CR=1 FL=1|nr:MAG: alpha/beta hydrolase [Desulfobulbaceae bacterium]